MVPFSLTCVYYFLLSCFALHTGASFFFLLFFRCTHISLRNVCRVALICFFFAHFYDKAQLLCYTRFFAC